MDFQASSQNVLNKKISRLSLFNRAGSRGPNKLDAVTMARDLVAQNLPEVGNHSIGRLNQDYPDVTSVAPIATRWGLPLGLFLQFRGRQPCATHGTLTPGTAFLYRDVRPISWPNPQGARRSPAQVSPRGVSVSPAARSATSARATRR